MKEKRQIFSYLSVIIKNQLKIDRKLDSMKLESKKLNQLHLRDSDRLKIFISFKENDLNLKVLSELSQEMENFGIGLYIAKNSLQPGTLWGSSIQKSLSDCHAGIIYQTEGYEVSPYCLQESGWLLSRNIPLLCITEPNAHPVGFLSQYQSLPSENVAILKDSILEWILNKNSIKIFLINSLLEALDNSTGSWYSRDPIWNIFEKIEELSADSIDAIESIAQRSNNFMGGEYRGSGPRCDFSDAFDRQMEK